MIGVATRNTAASTCRAGRGSGYAEGRFIVGPIGRSALLVWKNLGSPLQHLSFPGTQEHTAVRLVVSDPNRLVITSLPGTGPAQIISCQCLCTAVRFTATGVSADCASATNRVTSSGRACRELDTSFIATTSCPVDRGPDHRGDDGMQRRPPPPSETSSRGCRRSLVSTQGCRQRESPCPSKG